MFLYQETKALLNPKSLEKFVTDKLQYLGTSACPPYHLVFVLGGTSAEACLKVLKLASAKYLDALPTTGNEHGPIQLDDGRLLYLGKQLYTREQRIGAVESRDDGLTWQWLAEIPARPDDDATRSYHELHGVEAADGTIIAHIRNEYGANDGETLQAESKDGGKTWTVPHSIGVWGLPSHLLRLRDGRLLMTYGHRREPFGNQARVSDDGGHSWSEPMPLSVDGTTGDLGYPSTVEVGDGTLLTVWYESLKDRPLAVLRQTTWRME